MTTFDKLYIDGAWTPSDSTETIDVVDSVSEDVMATVPAGTAADVDRAVAAARAAFETWSNTSVDERAKYLSRIGDALGARTDELATAISQETGHGQVAVPARPGRAADQQLQVGCRAGRELLLRGDRSATRSSCASRSAWSAASRRGTIRCTRSPPRSPTPWPPGARWCSSRARWRRSMPSSSPRSSTRSGCPPACSTS